MSAFQNIVNKIEEQKSKIEELRKSYMEELQKEFNEAVKQFFVECPKIQAVVWNQYTPYFNDGDECIFGVNDPSFVVRNFDREELRNPYEYEDSNDTIRVPSYRDSWEEEIAYRKRELAETDSSWAKKYYPELISNMEKYREEFPGYDVKCKSFAKILTENEDLLQQVFGDHSSVYLTAEEAIVEEYNHD